MSNKGELLANHDRAPIKNIRDDQPKLLTFLPMRNGYDDHELIEAFDDAKNAGLIRIEEESKPMGPWIPVTTEDTPTTLDDGSPISHPLYYATTLEPNHVNQTHFSNDEHSNAYCGSETGESIQQESSLNSFAEKPTPEFVSNTWSNIPSSRQKCKRHNKKNRNELESEDAPSSDFPDETSAKVKGGRGGIPSLLQAWYTCGYHSGYADAIKELEAKYRRKQLED